MNTQEITKLLTRLHKIARELNEPFDDGKVIVEYKKRFGGISTEIAKTVIHPIYFPPEECKYESD